MLARSGHTAPLMSGRVQTRARRSQRFLPCLATSQDMQRRERTLKKGVGGSRV
jgi:hypothetical protein